MKIIVDENISFGKEAFKQFGEVVLINGRKISNAHLKDSDALIVRSITNVNKELLSGAKIKFVGTATIGTDHIDADYLGKNNIVFASAAGCNSYAVTEYVFSTITNLVNKHKIKLEGLSIGVIGYGNIGTKICADAEALRLRVFKNDPPVKRKTGRKDFYKLEEALSCDIVTFHVPLNKGGEDNTYHMLNEKNISLIKEGTILINSSRGPVIDNNALKERLLIKKDILTVLDVWEKEPDYDADLINLVELATPHIAGYSFEGKTNGTVMIYSALCKFLNILPTWKPELSAVSNNQIDINGDETTEKMLSKIFNKSYKVADDDKLLRKGSLLPVKEKINHFDSLRKNYRLRRELNNYTVKLKNGNDKTLKIIDEFRLDYEPD